MKTICRNAKVHVEYGEAFQSLHLHFALVVRSIAVKMPCINGLFRSRAWCVNLFKSRFRARPPRCVCTLEHACAIRLQHNTYEPNFLTCGAAQSLSRFADCSVTGALVLLERTRMHSHGKERFGLITKHLSY